jgi:hypothetical protein
MPKSWPSLRTLLSLATVVVPACGADDASPIPPVDPVPEATVVASLDAWKATLLKRCSVDGILGTTPASLDRPELDAALVLEALGGRLHVERGAEAVVLGAPEKPTHSGSSQRRITVTSDGAITRETVLSTVLDESGTCTVTYDGREVHRGRMWGKLPLIAQVKTPEVLAAVRVEGGIEPYVGTLQTYLEIDALDAVVDALAVDLASATALVGQALGLSPADAGMHVYRRTPWFAHVEAEGSNAPFSMFGGSGVEQVPVAYYATPMLPIATRDRAGWAPGSGEIERALTVRLARPAVAGSAELANHPLEIAVRFGLSRGTTAESAAGRVLSVAMPRTVAGSADIAAACFLGTASAAYDLVTGIGRAPLPAIVTTTGGGAVQRAWVTAPCEVWTDDLPAAVASSSRAVAYVDYLLNPAIYPQPSPLVPNGWEGFLADLTADLASVDALASDPARTLFVSAVPALRVLMQTPEYAAMPSFAQASLRRVLWKAHLTCAVLDVAALRAHLGARAAAVGAAVEAARTCPFAR